jgi:hypothetical protein
MKVGEVIRRFKIPTWVPSLVDALSATIDHRVPIKWGIGLFSMLPRSKRLVVILSPSVLLTEDAELSTANMSPRISDTLGVLDSGSVVAEETQEKVNLVGRFAGHPVSVVIRFAANKGTPPTYFLRGGELHRIGRDPDRQPVN